MFAPDRDHCGERHLKQRRTASNGEGSPERDDKGVRRDERKNPRLLRDSERSRQRNMVINETKSLARINRESPFLSPFSLQNQPLRCHKHKWGNVVVGCLYLVSHREDRLGIDVYAPGLHKVLARVGAKKTHHGV
jgi:hypothetical protein